MTCRNKDEHRWPRQFDSRLVRAGGAREIWTCNDCLATKIVFRIDQADGGVVWEAVIAQPPPGIG